MRQSISTKFMGPTNSRGARVKATATGGSTLSHAYDHELSDEENHVQAARALAAQLNHKGSWHAGSTKDGFVFINSPRTTFTI